MNKTEIENRIVFLRNQLPEKKFVIEKAIKELQILCEEILQLENKIKEIK